MCSCPDSRDEKAGLFESVHKIRDGHAVLLGPSPVAAAEALLKSVQFWPIFLPEMSQPQAYSPVFLARVLRVGCVRKCKGYRGASDPCYMLLQGEGWPGGGIT